MDGNGAVRAKCEICITACRYIGHKRKELHPLLEEDGVEFKIVARETGLMSVSSATVKIAKH